MLRNRVIPVLLVKDHGLVKTTKFENPKYVGDPINAIRIFNEKEVDELALLDISATPGNHGPNFDLVQDVASECFMPLAYGGGIRGLDDAKRLFSLGIEKVVLRSAAATRPSDRDRDRRLRWLILRGGVDRRQAGSVRSPTALLPGHALARGRRLVRVPAARHRGWCRGGHPERRGPRRDHVRHGHGPDLGGGSS